MTPFLAMLGLLVSAFVTLHYGLVMHRTVLFDGLYVTDPLAAFLKLAGFVAVATAIFYSQDYLDQREIPAASTTCCASPACWVCSC